MSARRIAVVHSFYASAQPSGENESVLAEVAALRGAGLEVALFARYSDVEMRRRGYAIAAALTTATGIGPAPDERSLARFAPDVIHVHNLFPNFGTRWLERTRAPVVATMHNYRPFCSSALLYRDDIGDCTACPDGRQWEAVRHRCYRDSAVRTLPLAVSRRGAGDVLVRSARRVIALTRIAAETMAGYGVPAEKITVSPNFLPDSMDLGVGSGGPAFLYAGRLSDEKGIVPLLTAWPPDVPLVVVGAGVLEPDVRQLCTGAISFEGSTDRAGVLKRLQRSAGLVMPSLWREGFPLVYAEALAAGTPVLAWDTNGVAALVHEDGAGAVATWTDVDGAVRQAVSTFPQLRRRAREVFVARYSEARHVAALRAVYDSVA